jgi:hypothetical protein
MIRHDLRLSKSLGKGLGWARSAHLWMLERMIAADFGSGDLRWAAVGFALRALRALPPFKNGADATEGRATGLPDGRHWSFAC